MDTLSTKIEQQEFNGRYKQKTIKAINSENKEQLFKALQELNNILTNKPNEGHFSPGAANTTKEELEKFINDVNKVKNRQKISAEIVIYLGGATQRLLIEYDGGEIIFEPLDFSSETKQKWDQLQ